MKTFIKTTLAAGLICSALNTYAQGPFLNFNTGYAFRAGSESVWQESSAIDANGVKTTTLTDVRTSLGQGLNFGLGGGYMFNEYLGAGMDFNFHFGSTPTIKESNTTSGTTISSSNTDMSAFQFRIIPHLVLTTHNEGLNVYGKMGIVLGVYNTMTQTVSDTKTTGANKTTTTESEWKYSGGMPLGFSSALGVKYPLGDKLSLFGELSMISMSYSPTHGEYIKYTVDGENKLNDMKTIDKQSDYSTELTLNSKDKPSEDSPAKELAPRFPFSSIGFNIGLHINLGD